MRIITTKKFEKLSAWLNTFPQIDSVKDMFKNRNDSKEDIEDVMKEDKKEKKKKKKLYQINLDVEDIGVRDFNR